MQFQLLSVHPRDVYKTVFMDSDVHESPESSDIRDYPRKFHPRFEVIDFMDVIGETELLCRLTGIQTGLGEFLQDVVDSRQTEVSLDIILRTDAGYEFFIADQTAGSHSQVTGHPVHYVVALRMDGGIVQRILRITDSQEAGALFEGLGAEFRDLTQLPARLEATDGRPEGYYVGG